MPPRSGPSALGLMSQLMCVCTGNGTVVRGHWEARENIMENRPQSESGRGEWDKDRERDCCRWRVKGYSGMRQLCNAVCFSQMNIGGGGTPFHLICWSLRLMHFVPRTIARRFVSENMWRQRLQSCVRSRSHLDRNVYNCLNIHIKFLSLQSWDVAASGGPNVSFRLDFKSVDAWEKGIIQLKTYAQACVL